MNILQVEDIIKGLPDQRLIQEAQSPSGQVPQFLVVSELQRRGDMRRRYANQNKEMPEGTVKSQIVQQGIAALQQQQPQAPQQAPQQMASGGIVRMANYGQVPRYGGQYDLYDDDIYRFAMANGLDPATFKRQLMVESRMNPNAVSPAGAVGLAQIMPATAANPGFGVDPLTEEQLRDPREQIRFAANYMGAMQNEFGDPTRALQAYHSGVGNVRKDVAGIEALGPRGQAYADKVMNYDGPTNFGIPPFGGIRLAGMNMAADAMGLNTEYGGTAGGGEAEKQDSPLTRSILQGGAAGTYGNSDEDDGSGLWNTVKSWLFQNAPAALEGHEKKMQEAGSFANKIEKESRSWAKDAAEMEKPYEKWTGTWAPLKSDGTKAEFYPDTDEEKDDQRADANGMTVQGIADFRKFMKDRKPIPVPDFSKLIQEQRDDAYAAALVQLGSGIAADDLSGGLSRAGIAALSAKKDAREMQQAQDILAYKAAQGEMDRDVDILGKVAGLELQQARNEIERMESEGKTDRQILQFASYRIQEIMDGTTTIDPAERMQAVRLAINTMLAGRPDLIKIFFGEGQAQQSGKKTKSLEQHMGG